MPGWLFYLDLWEITSILAYALTFALLESLVILLVFLIIAAIMPARLIHVRFVTIGTIAVLVTAAWTIFAQYNDHALREMPARILFFWLLLFLASLGGLYMLVWRQKWFAALVRALAERLSILLYIYLPLSLLGIVVVVLRNIA
jgi:hypothetical protein